jgi:hypothetical protein
MPVLTGHKNVQARILKLAQEIGWAYLVRPETKGRH